MSQNVLIELSDALADAAEKAAPVRFTKATASFSQARFDVGNLLLTNIDSHNFRDLVLFHEYFHGDNGAGLGASHQTGWTGLVAILIERLARRPSEMTKEIHEVDEQPAE